MPPTVHKLLIHGADISKEAILPVGQLSEDVLESRNKDIRKFRLHNTLKISREATNEDLFRRLLLTSDPLISSISFHNNKLKEDLDPEVKKLIDFGNDECEDESDDESSEDE